MGLFDLFHSVDINAGIDRFGKVEGAVLIDVRTVDEYSNGHIDGSINIPLNRISSIGDVVKDKDTPLFVYCHSGARSSRAVSLLKRMGYANAQNIGGIAKYRGEVVK